MGREDAVLALDRHATSKVRSAADLVGVATFGFRGEALPAIASVSRFALTTSRRTRPGTELDASPAAGSTGWPTPSASGARRSRCAALFFNTPARRKFLRSAASETRAAHEAVATLALAHPGSRVRARGGRHHAPAGARRIRRRRSGSPRCGDASSRARWCRWAMRPARSGSTGFVQRPGDAQPTGRRTQLFVNGRPFKDPFLVRAAEAGYRSAIHPGDRPVAATSGSRSRRRTWT